MSAAMLRKLKGEAREAAWARGHEALSVFTTHPGKKSAIAECECGAYVRVDCSPPPNGIDIGGDAVAINCPLVFKWRKWRPV